MSVDFVLIRILFIHNWIEPFRRSKIGVLCFRGWYARIAFPGTDFDHEEFVILLGDFEFSVLKAFNLSDNKLMTSFFGWDFEAFLADSLDSVRAGNLWFDIDLIDNHSFIFLLELLTHVGIDNTIDSFEVGSSIAKIKLEFIFNSAPLDTFRIDLLIFF